MSKPAAATWVCPICGRRVPKREPECFCGAKQQAAQQHHVQQARKTSTRIPLDVALLVLAIVLVGVYGLHRLTQDLPDREAAGGKLLAAVVAPPEPPPPLPALPSQAPPATAEPPVQRAPPPPLPPVETPAPEPLSLATPPPAAPAATPTPFDERAQQRAAGLAAYEAALQRLASRAARLANDLGVYATQCGAGPKYSGGISNCDEVETAVARTLLEIQQGLDAAEDDARRAWLDPGQVRDARGRSLFGSRQWDDLVGAAQRIKR
jgi:hypothetical protein